jgi:hypothetical protein
MAAYKKQFTTLLNYNASQATYSSTGLTSLPSYGYSPQDDPSDIRVEPDDQTNGNNIPVGGNTTGQLVGHRVFRFATLSAASANCTVGTPTYMADAFGSLATTVYASGIGTVTSGNNGWWQIRGWHAGANTTGSVPVAGDLLVGSSTTGVFGRAAATGNTSNTLPLAVTAGTTTGNLTVCRLMIPE